MAKEKKEITYRPMFGYEDVSRKITPIEKLREEDKDETIRQLRASLALLEAKDEKRRTVARETMRKKRAKS